MILRALASTEENVIVSKRQYRLHGNIGWCALSFQNIGNSILWFVVTRLHGSGIYRGAVSASSYVVLSFKVPGEELIEQESGVARSSKQARRKSPSLFSKIPPLVTCLFAARRKARHACRKPCFPSRLFLFISAPVLAPTRGLCLLSSGKNGVTKDNACAAQAGHAILEV
jgi:hypothetical protein